MLLATCDIDQGARRVQRCTGPRRRPRPESPRRGGLAFPAPAGSDSSNFTPHNVPLRMNTRWPVGRSGGQQNLPAACATSCSRPRAPRCHRHQAWGPTMLEDGAAARAIICGYQKRLPVGAVASVAGVPPVAGTVRSEPPESAIVPSTLQSPPRGGSMNDAMVSAGPPWTETFFNASLSRSRQSTRPSGEKNGASPVTCVANNLWARTGQSASRTVGKCRPEPRDRRGSGHRATPRPSCPRQRSADLPVGSTSENRVGVTGVDRGTADEPCQSGREQRGRGRRRRAGACLDAASRLAPEEKRRQWSRKRRRAPTARRRYRGTAASDPSADSVRARGRSAAALMRGSALHSGSDLEHGGQHLGDIARRERRAAR